MYQRLVAVAMMLVFGLVGMGWWYSPIGQIQQVRWKLAEFSMRVSDISREKAALAFLKDGSLERAIATAESITDSRYKSDALTAIVTTIGQIDNFPEADKSLERAFVAAESITDSYYQTNFLKFITETQVKLDRWREAHNTVSFCNTNECQVESLSLILTAWAEKKNPELKELKDEN